MLTACRYNFFVSLAALRNSPIVFVTAVLLVLGGCSNDSQLPVQPRDYGLIGGESGTELAAVQVLHKGNGAEPQTLDPHRAQGVPAGNILRDLYEPLVMEAPDGELIAGAAKSWVLSDDGLVYTFTLRSDGHWSNGDPVTAGDWAFSLRRGLDPATLSVYSGILFPINNAAATPLPDISPTQKATSSSDNSI